VPGATDGAGVFATGGGSARIDAAAAAITRSRAVGCGTADGGVSGGGSGAARGTASARGGGADAGADRCADLVVTTRGGADVR
jgi:3-hydroxyisobutyrate dehydrogenase-like beta-hydroxyacid dehydrogenase